MPAGDHAEQEPNLTPQTLHGVIKDFGGLISASSTRHLPITVFRDVFFAAVRVLLGLTEAGMYPGIVFYISR